MINQADITFQDNKFLVTGNLDFSNVMSVYDKSLNYLKDCPEFIFDFSSLNSSDSSGLALIIEWVKFADQCQKPIRFLNLSEDLMSIAQASKLDQLIQKS